MDSDNESQLLDPNIVLLALDILWNESNEKKVQPHHMALILIFPLVSKRFKRRPLIANSYPLLLLFAYSHAYEDIWHDPKYTFGGFGDYIVGMKVTGPVVMEFTYWDNLARPISYFITESFEFDYPYALNYFNGFSLCVQNQENIRAVKWRFINIHHRSYQCENALKLIQLKRIVLYNLRVSFDQRSPAEGSPLILRD